MRGWEAVGDAETVGVRIDEFSAEQVALLQVSFAGSSKTLRQPKDDAVQLTQRHSPFCRHESHDTRAEHPSESDVAGAHMRAATAAANSSFAYMTAAGLYCSEFVCFLVRRRV